MAQIILTTTGTNNWTVPSDWSNLVNTIEVIGGGAGGGGNGAGGAGGGGGGAYSKITALSLVPGSSVSYTIGLGGAGGGIGANGVDGGDTFFNGATLGASSVGAKAGTKGFAANTNGTGGASASGVGTTKNSGGNGGSGATNGGGGGGAAGPNGVGNVGANGSGAGGGNGGSGDNGSGGSAGVAPSGAGGNGTEWTTVGSGGGGAGGAATGGSGGNYGAGGGGGNNAGASSGGAGIQGLIVITYTPISTDRYWVGGAGNWDTTTTHWAATSGGTGGEPVPISSSNVFFNGSSGAGTATVAATSACASLVFTGYTGTLAGSSALSVYGILTLVAGMSITYTGTLTFAATASGKTVTTASKTLACPIIFDGVGGGWTISDALTSTATVTLTNGSLNLNNLSITIPSFSSSNSNTRVLTLGNGTLTLNSSGTVWNIATSTGLTLTANSSTIKLTDATASAKTFSGGSKTYNNLWLTGAGTGAYTIVGSNTFADFKCDTPPHTINFTAGSTTTAATYTLSGTAGNLMTLQSTTSGSAWFISKSGVNTISLDYLSLQDSHVV